MKKFSLRTFELLRRNWILVFLLLFGFILRFYGLRENYSFWSDEDYVAVFVRAILERGRPVLANGVTSGSYLWLFYWLEAIFAKTFGLNELALRFPSVIFGILTIWIIYFFGKEIFDRKTGLVAALLATFLKIEILWSRQARPYQILQFLYLLGAYFLYKTVSMPKDQKKDAGRYFLGFFLCGVIASLFLGLGLVILIDGLLVLLLTQFNRVRSWVIPAAALFLLVLIPFFEPLKKTFLIIGRTNYLYYYRVFLTHDYSILFLMACLGGAFLIFQKQFSRFWLFFIFLANQGFFISFLVGKSFIRYLYVVFPFLILLASSGLTKLAGLKEKRFFFLTSVILTFSLIGKIVFIPQHYYSLNEDMQETPEVDWKKIYNFTDGLIKRNRGIVLLVNWQSSAVWYLGEERNDFSLKLLRKGSTLVHIDNPFNLPLIKTLPDFLKIKQELPKGIVVIDSWDDYVPEGVREYCRGNLKKEFELDRLYPKQPRYWPVTVYSWGI